jgi:hypothetical protein
MRELVAAVAGPREFSDTRQSWLNRAARRAGISYRTVKAIFYGEIEQPNHPSIRLLRHAAQQRAQALAGRFEEIARGMERADASFYRADVLALLDIARALRGVDRAGDDPTE